MTTLACEIVEVGKDIDASVIWLHGLGASGHDFVPIVPELKLPPNLGVRFVFPHAPSIPVTINGGMVMPAWYDILSLSIEREIDTEQILASTRAVFSLIETQIAQGIDSRRIVLAGFSQGGAVVYHAGLTCSKPLAGIMAMSTYFATRDMVSASEINANLPIAIFHGTRDPIVPELLGKSATDSLISLGYKPEYRTYPMEHMVHPQEIEDISSWLQRVLA